MKQSQLDRLLRFAQRTGDRLIITDSEGKRPVVILSLDEYEALLGGRQTALQNPLRQESLDEDGVALEESVDLDSIEAVVEAANREFTESEEPKVVPIARKVPSSDPGEEQFYMEPI